MWVLKVVIQSLDIVYFEDVLLIFSGELFVYNCYFPGKYDLIYQLTRVITNLKLYIRLIPTYF